MAKKSSIKESQKSPKSIVGKSSQSSLSVKLLMHEVIQDILIFLDIAGYFGLGPTMDIPGYSWTLPAILDWEEQWCQ